MTALEFVLLICGIVCIVLSFVLDKDKNEESRIVSGELTESQKENIKNQISAIIDNELELLNEKTEVVLDKISNTKVMEMNEYVDTVLNDINKNHNEAVFLYDMLNEKAKEIKIIVKDFNNAIKQAQKMQEEIAFSSEVDRLDEFTNQSPSVLTNENEIDDNKSNVGLKNTVNYKSQDDILRRKVSNNLKESAKESSREIEDNIVDMNIQFEKGSNNNEKILKLFKNGKSNKDIAKELNLGVGEVKLVIDLYNSGI